MIVVTCDYSFTVGFGDVFFFNMFMYELRVIHVVNVVTACDTV